MKRILAVVVNVVLFVLAVFFGLVAASYGAIPETGNERYLGFALGTSATVSFLLFFQFATPYANYLIAKLRRRPISFWMALGIKG